MSQHEKIISDNASLIKSNEIDLRTGMVVANQKSAKKQETMNNSLTLTKKQESQKATTLLAGHASPTN
jgi:hypothetical protein